MGINKSIGNLFSSIKIGLASLGNYFEVESDGTWVNKGASTVWDEVSQPFVGRNIFAVAGRVDYNYTELTLDFSTTARYPNEPVGIVTQLMHARKKDSDIRPHVHWMQNSADQPNILIAYRWCNNGGVPSDWALKALTVADNIYEYTTGDGTIQQITEFNLPEDHGIDKGLSSTFDCKIYRDNANTSGLFEATDTYAGVWSAKYYDIHFEKDMNGSREEFVK